MAEETGMSPDPILQSMMRVEKARTEGHAAFEEGNFRAAVRHYTEAIALSPDDPSLYCDRSSAHASLKDFAGALTDAKKAYELRPRCPRSHLVLGLASLGLGSTNIAMNYLNAGLVVDPDNARLKAVIARVSIEARKANSMSMKKNLTNPSAALGPSQGNNVVPLSDSQRLAPFVPLGDQSPFSYSYPHGLYPHGLHLQGLYPHELHRQQTLSLQMQPINSEDAMMRGNAALNEGNPRAAVLQYTNGIALSPDEFNLYCWRSAAYASLGEFALAREDATRALELSPGSPIVYLRLGLVHLGLSRPDLALKALKHGLKIDPNDQSLKAACARANAEALKTVKMCRDIMAMGLLSNPGKLLAAQALSESAEEKPLPVSSSDTACKRSKMAGPPSAERLPEAQRGVVHVEHPKTLKVQGKLKRDPKDAQTSKGRDMQKITEPEPESSEGEDTPQGPTILEEMAQGNHLCGDKASGSKICHPFGKQEKEEGDGFDDLPMEELQLNEVEDKEVPDPNLKKEIDDFNVVVEQNGHNPAPSDYQIMADEVPFSEPKRVHDIRVILYDGATNVKETKGQQVPFHKLSEILNSTMKEKDHDWQLL